MRHNASRQHGEKNSLFVQTRDKPFVRPSYSLINFYPPWHQLDYYTLSRGGSPTHWRTIPDIGDVPVCSIKDLSPSDTIFAVVRARNEHGLSPPSPVSKAMRTSAESNGVDGGGGGDSSARIALGTASGSVVELKKAEVVGPRKIRLEWKLLQQSSAGKSLPLDGYHIQVRDAGDPDGVFDAVTISGGATRSHTLSDLRPDTRYEVFVVPFYNRIKGAPSNMRVATTKEDGKQNKGH